MTTVLAAFSAVLGAIVGSFLNACIHRMPRGISLSNPKRSFCPSCNKLIPWYENIPVVSWSMLWGNCSGCGGRIPARYVLVEILTAGCFLALWFSYGLPLAPVYWVFLALLIAATFIDIEHYIIPDEITLGGTVAGLVCALALPALMGADSRWIAGGLSLAGAALGAGLLWLVVEGGKLAFGRKKHTFESAQAFRWIRDGDRADLVVGEETHRWEDIFSRESDVLVLNPGGPVTCDGLELPAGPLRFHYDRLNVGEEELNLDKLGGISGALESIVIPREAMGFGDVKFLACIGAFLGWQAVLFTIFSSSIIGCVAGVAGILLSRGKARSVLPFGPYLALGAALWLFGGRELTGWYFSQFQR
ncbi:MAG: prepilin peptidase [Verrucomicrobia bacterium]|nr:prepilin peptidase [Verrucomicrobiota bacterium]